MIDLYHKTINANSYLSFYCFKNCLKQILEYKKIKDSILFLDCTLPMFYEKRESESTFSCGSSLDMLLPILKNKIQCYQIDDKMSNTKINEIIDQNISQGNPVVLAVDIYYLPYTSFYHEMHGIHGIILCGFNQEKTAAYIIDMYTDWSYKGEINMFDLERARISLNKGDGVLSEKPINYLSIVLSSDLGEITSDDLIKNFFESMINTYYLDNDKNLYEGHRALNKLYSDLSSYFKNEKNEELSQLLTSLRSSLFFITYRYRSTLVYLSYLKNFFPNNYNLLESLKVIDELINKWKIVYKLVIKNSLLITQKTIFTLLNEIENLIIKEKKFYYFLYKLYCEHY